MQSRLLTFILMSFLALHANGQDSTSLIDKIAAFPGRLLGKLNGKVADINKRLDKQTERYLRQLDKQEAKLKKKYSRFDSATAKQLFSGNIEQRYASYLGKLKADTTAIQGLRPAAGGYSPNADSLQTSLAFLKQNPQFLDASKVSPADIQSSLARLQALQGKLGDADLLRSFIQQRRDQIRQYLSRYEQLPPGIMNVYNDYNKQLYYYAQQVKAYRDMLDDPDKLLKTALQWLNKVPAFAGFYRNNSMLASLFNLPGGAPTGPAIGQGLPSRDQVLAAFQSQSGLSGPNALPTVQQSTQSAQDQVSQWKDKLSSYGNSGGADLNTPEFKPNTQRTKSFLKRLVYGVNLQTVQSSYFFPVTSDVGLSVGYKLDDNNEIGIGASYKIGWGSDISHIRITGQGAGLRSYGDFKIKKTWYASGGFEYNYEPPISLTGLAHLPDLNDWQQSGLVGISKIIQFKSKFLKASKFQVLWDFLSYQQVPKTAPVKFRIGYNF